MHTVLVYFKAYYKDALIVNKIIVKVFATSKEAEEYVIDTEHVGNPEEDVYYFCSCVVYGDEIDLTKCLEL